MNDLKEDAMNHGKRIIERHHILGSIRYSPDAGYVYLNNPKCACSTIKYALWSMEKEAGRIDYLPDPKQLHGIGFWSHHYDFQDRDDVFVFSVVRNPFTRILSTYLDKIAKKNVIRDTFCRLYQVKGNRDISFGEFLETIGQSPSHYDDLHWRLQTDNILFDALRIDFIGHLENIDQDLPHALNRVFRTTSFEPRQSHQTNAARQIEDFFGPREIEIVREKYSSDFENFGYSYDPKVTRPVGTARTSREDPAILEFLSAIGKQEGNPTKALEHLDRAMALDEGNPVYPAYKAGMLNNLGKNVEARRFARRAINIDATYAQGHYMMALALRGEERPKPALDHARKAVSLAPHSHMHWWCLSSLLFKKGNLKGAEQAIQTAINMIDSGAARHYLLLAQIQSAQGRQEAALESCKRVLELQTTRADILLKVSAIYADAERRSEAIELLHDARAAFPSQLEVLIKLAGLLESDHRYSEAREVLMEAMALNPENRRAKALLQRIGERME
jgi:tetratricopeptide (TPR) repeat protein